MMTRRPTKCRSSEGKAKNRFRSFATIKGILPAIQKDPEPDLPKTAVRGDNEIKKQKDARERNNRAVHWLNFSLEGEDASLY
jgi:hypothetical protein